MGTGEARNVLGAQMLGVLDTEAAVARTGLAKFCGIVLTNAK